LVRLRLRRMGKKKQPFYRIVVIDSRNARDGRYIENLGFYNPLKDPAEISLVEERALYWLQQGAIPSFTVKSFLKRKGILLKWHLTKQGADEIKIDEELKKWEVLQLEREKRLLALDDQAKRKKRSKKQAAAQEEPEAKVEQEVATEDKSETPVTETAETAEPAGDQETQPQAIVGSEENASESKTDEPVEAALKEQVEGEIADVKAESKEKTAESNADKQNEAAQQEQPEEEIKEVSDEVKETEKGEVETAAAESEEAGKEVVDKES